MTKHAIEPRNRQENLKVSATELEVLKGVSKYLKIPKSEIIRTAVNEYLERAFSEGFINPEDLELMRLRELHSQMQKGDPKAIKEALRESNI
jgi:hypothetical protein